MKVFIRLLFSFFLGVILLFYMTLPLWGQQQKSQDDPETIEQAIDRIVDEHNAAPESHLGSGESLESHKTDEMVDHPAGSIAIDKLAQARVIVSAFESIDGWITFDTGSGAVIHDFANLRLSTGTTSGSIVIIYATPSAWVAFDTSKQFFWKTTLRFTSDTNQEARFGIGALGGGDGLSGAGFRVVDGVLYGYTEDDEVVNSNAISGVDITQWNVYEVRYYPITETFEFYVNGTLGASEIRSFSVTQEDNVALFSLKNTAAEAKRIDTSDLLIQIER